MVKYINNKEMDTNQLKELYDDAGWEAYTKDMEKLKTAIKNSQTVITAWDEDKLVGLVRAVGDGETILYVQDILVLKSYKRKGIGSKLIKLILDSAKDIRQKVLLTEESQETRGFYESIGFKSCDKGDVVAFAKFN